MLAVVAGSDAFEGFANLRDLSGLDAELEVAVVRLIFDIEVRLEV